MAVRVGLVLALGPTSCVEGIFVCRDDDECRDGARAGVCAAGYCAFDDDECVTRYAYGDRSPAEIAGKCVSDLEPASSSGIAESSSATIGSADADTADPSGGPDGTDGTCSEGESCIPDDPCATVGRCSTTGSCVPIELVVCDDPPSACHDPNGTCGPLGACEYQPLPSGSDCSDGDECTIGDACDGAGECTPGAICPNTDPCQTTSCESGGCVSQPKPDGTTCGAAASARCCVGACVDISSDTAHCGGCNTPCADGLACESISETSTCEVSPEATSGRCLCDFSNEQCPLGQLCRTFEPYTDRCVPPTSDNCDGIRVEQNSCPTFCSYD